MALNLAVSAADADVFATPTVDELSAMVKEKFEEERLKDGAAGQEVLDSLNTALATLV